MRVLVSLLKLYKINFSGEKASPPADPSPFVFFLTKMNDCYSRLRFRPVIKLEFHGTDTDTDFRDALIL